MLYLAWSLVPVLIAIVFSFNAGRSRSTWQGASLRWWTGDAFNALFTDAALRGAMLQTLRLGILTVLVAVPLGTLFAVGLHRWRGRTARAADFGMLLSFVLPEIILAVSLFLTFTNVLGNAVRLGTVAQAIGLITLQVSFTVIIVRARLLSLGNDLEEAAMDLGAPPTHALRRVVLPLLTPAILASIAITFADAVDDFVIVRYLSGPASSEPLSVKVYSAARASPTPAVNAAATVMLVATTAIIAIGFVLYRRLTRSQGASV